MYKNVGKEIKTWAGIYIAMMMVPAVLLGLVFVVLCTVALEVRGFLISFIPAVIYIGMTYILARRNEMELYAFGEITENVVQIREYITANSVQVSADTVSPPTQQNKSTWHCSACGHENPGNALVCQKCSSVR